MNFPLFLLLLSIIWSEINLSWKLIVRVFLWFDGISSDSF